MAKYVSTEGKAVSTAEKARMAAARANPPKLDWKYLVKEGFTNEPGSPQEAKAFEDLVHNAPVGTLHTFINGMNDTLRQAYIPPLASALRRRLRGSDLSLSEDYSLVPVNYWMKDLGNAMLGTDVHWSPTNG